MIFNCVFNRHKDVTEHINYSHVFQELGIGIILENYNDNINLQNINESNNSFTNIMDLTQD